MVEWMGDFLFLHEQNLPCLLWKDTKQHSLLNGYVWASSIRTSISHSADSRSPCIYTSMTKARVPQLRAEEKPAIRPCICVDH